jgi:hypothetical protein
MLDESTVTGNGAGQEHSPAEDAAFLAEGEEKEFGDKKQESKEEEKEEVKEEEEKEEEVKEETEEELEEEKEEEPDETKDQVKARPPFKKILQEFPTLFKKFPDLREMYFREQEYTKAFPTVEDAKEAVEKNERFDTFDELVSAGTPEKTAEFLAAVKESDKDIHDNFVRAFLPALSKHDPDAYFEVLTPISQNLIRDVYNAGVRLGNKDLMNSALHFAQYYFDDKDIATGKKSVPVRSSELSPEKEKFEQEKEEFYSKQFETAQNSVESDLSSKLGREISRGLETDFNEFMVKTLTKEIKIELDEAITKDPNHMARMKSFWKQARTNGFSKESLGRISSAYLSRARQLLPEIKNRIRSEALSDKKAKADKDLKKSNDNTSRREITSGGQQRFGTKVTDPKKIDYSKTSDKDILEDKVTLRR